MGYCNDIGKVLWWLKVELETVFNLVTVHVTEIKTWGQNRSWKGFCAEENDLEVSVTVHC